MPPIALSPSRPSAHIESKTLDLDQQPRHSLPEPNGVLSNDIPEYPLPAVEPKNAISLLSEQCRQSDHVQDGTDDVFNGALSTPAEDGLEPIAIIGLGLKFPEDATSPEAFWKMLVEGKSAMTEVPKDRFNIDAFYDPESDIGMLKNRGAHFIKDDLAGFDAPFFSISPAEAACMDPQQRWLLEVAYEAFENAGIPIENIAGSATSVHIGSFLGEYDVMFARDPELQAKYKSTGTALSMLANRLSWFYDLTGPSIALDTACSSSLNALHLACQSLRAGESSMGLVGGSNLVYNPDMMIPLSDLNFLSPDSRSYSFDHRANGYSRGEGIGIVLIKRLSDAIRDGDTIRAVVRATGANQDGRTPGVTQPNAKAQEALIKSTYEAGALDMKATRYFEAHATGTPVGDPLEASAIHSAFESHLTHEESPLYVGAVKSNIGHLEGASGVAGLIKTVLVLENGIIPPNINFERVNPKIPIDKWNLKFPLEPTPWPSKGLRRASVNSFGFGGANAHAVLDDAYHYMQSRNLQGRHRTAWSPPSLPSLGRGNTTQGRPVANGTSEIHASEIDTNNQAKLLVWSASDKAGLDRLATLYQAHHHHHHDLSFYKDESRYLEDLAYTLSERRSSLPWKSFAVVKSIDQLDQHLKHDLSVPIRSIRSPKLGFVFTGQGAQWYAMGRELLQFAVYKQSLVDAEIYFKSLGASWLLLDELGRDPGNSQLSNPIYSQPVCTALQIALVELLASWDIQPSVVIGHSSGEIAAAYCVGGLSRSSAWKVAYYRGVVASLVEKTHKAHHEPMAMMSVGLSEAAIQPHLRDMHNDEGSVSVAAINSPKNITLSGSEEMVDSLAEDLDQEDIFHRKLKVNVAYHSDYMQDSAFIYQTLIQNIEAGEPRAEASTMISTVTGKTVTKDELRASTYWVQNMVSPVKFSQALKCLSASTKKLGSSLGARKESMQVNHLLEIGPHATLQGPLRDTINIATAGDGVSYSSVLVRNRSALETILEAVGGLHCLGFPINLNKVHDLGRNNERSMLTSLPAYPFNHSKTYWLESRLSSNYRFRKSPPQNFLGTPVSDWNPLEPRWRKIITLSDDPWISDHKVHGSSVYPAAGMLVMAIEASRQLSDHSRTISGFHFRDVIFHRALVISSTSGAETQFMLRPSQETTDKFLRWSDFRLSVYKDGEWTENCQGSVALEYDICTEEERKETAHQYKRDYDAGAKLCNVSLGTNQFYDQLKGIGVTYGSSFRSLEDVHFGRNGVAKALADLQQWKSGKAKGRIQPHVIHPAALDAIFQLIFLAQSKGSLKEFPTMVPTKIRAMWIGESENCLYRSSEDRQRIGEDIVRVFAKAQNVGFRDGEASLLALDVDSGQPRLSGSIESTSLGSSETSPSTDTARSPLCYNMVWKPDLELLSNQDIETYCSKDVRLDPEWSTSDTSTAKQKRLVCHVAILKALDEVLSLDQSQPHFRKYIQWMEREVSNCPPDSFARARTELAKGEDNISTLSDILEKTGVNGEVTVRVARNLIAILRGDISALELLFNDGLMEQYYRWTHHGTTCFQQMEKYVDAMAHKNPSLKVLEIGAGTGGATEAILGAITRDGQENLTRCESYTFTDISPSFFEKAKEKFKDSVNKMTFSTLNIEQDPCDQGFEGHAYDVIVASNVLHATADLENTLRNTQKLLKPGGKLILYEITTPDGLLPGFVFGLLPGWWLSIEENRTWGPVLTESAWHDILLRSGFDGIDVSLRAQDKEQLHECSVMISSASKEVETNSSPHTTIITTEQSLLQHDVAEQLLGKLKTQGMADCRVISIKEMACTNLDNTTCIFLPEIERSFLSQITEKDYSNLQKAVFSASSILWVTMNDSIKRTLVTGLARGLQGEWSKLRFTSLSLQANQNPSTISQRIIDIFQAASAASSIEYEMEYAEKDGLVCINRVIEAHNLNSQINWRTKAQGAEMRKFRAKQSRNLKLSISSPGLLDTLAFVDDLEQHTPIGPDEIDFEVKACGVNLRDILIALGQTSGDYLGMEGAGIVTQCGAKAPFSKGDRVCCFSKGALKTSIRCKSFAAVKIPDSVSLQEASGLPTIFCTAYYSLFHWARIKQGDSILIHSGAGGLGQAAIQLAQIFNANIYTTVGSEEKKLMLMETYGIPEDHIFSSRTTAFAQSIKRATNGRGVNIILNSLAGEALRASWECIAPFGRFIEAGKKDIHSYGTLPMHPFSKNVSFASVDLVTIFHQDEDLMAELLQAVFKLAEEKKIFPPSPMQVFNASQIEEAFRLMQSGKNKGKLVIELNDDDLVPTIPSMLPTCSFNPCATYLITGGLGGLGRSIARWMVHRNARNLILLSRSGAQSTTAQAFVQELEDQGAKIVTPSCDVGNKEMLATIFAECAQSMPPIKGCIQGSMVLKDSEFRDMTCDQFTAVLGPKVSGSWNLHSLLPEDLDFFILLSSLCGIIGSPGQSNYAAASTYQDALAHHRVALGQKAVSIDLGNVLDVGYAAEREGLADKLQLHGYSGIQESELHAMLDYFCDPECPLEGPHVQTMTGLEIPAVMRSKRLDDSFWMHRSLFKQLHQIDTPETAAAAAASQVSETAVNYESLIRAAESIPEAGDVICDALRDKLSRTLAIDKENVDAGRPIHTYGVDSLAAVELRTWFRRVIGADVAVFEILGNTSMAALGPVVAAKSLYVDAKVKASTG